MRRVSATRRVHRQRRMAAREDQPQPVVRDRAHRVLGHGLHRRLAARSASKAASRASRTWRLARTAGRRRSRSIARFRAVVVIHAAGVVRDAADRPRLERGDERVLDRLLGEVEVAEHADERRDRPSLLLAEQAVDDLVRGLGGRQARSSATVGRSVGDGSAAAGSVPNSQIGRTSIEPSRAAGIIAA